MDFPQCEPQSYGAIVPSPTSDGTPLFSAKESPPQSCAQ